jgi:hypothetical protein
MGKWHFVASICGWLSLLCWLPFLLLTLTPGHLAPYPGWMGAMILRGLFMSPLAGISLALIAATTRRQWLVLAGVWLAALGYGWWSMERHPFDL